MGDNSLYDKIGQFVAIPHTVVSMIPVIGVDAFVLFCYLRYTTNKDSGDSFPSYETIKSSTCLSLKRIASAIRCLEKHGLLSRKKRYSKSSIYTLTMPPNPSKKSSPAPDTGMVSPAPVEGTVLPQVQTNKINSNKSNDIHNGESTVEVVSTTREIQSAFQEACGYPVNWKSGNATAAKWLSVNGYSADEVSECYKYLKSQEFWSNKTLSLPSVVNQIGEWKVKNGAKKRRTIGW